MCKAERDTLKCKCVVLKALLCYDWELWRVIRSSVCVRILTSVCIDCLPLNVYSLQQWSNESLLHSSWRQQDVCVRMCECECVFVCVSAHAVANDREWMTDSGGNVYSVKSFDLELIGSEQQDAQQKVNWMNWWFLYIHSSTFQGNPLTKCYWTEWWCKDPSFNQLVSRWNMNC